jgi:Flp pilus assembly protein TadB
MDTTSRARRAYAAGDLRVSDADRDRALAELSEHFQAGRLTADELEGRTGRALSARTGHDLAVLLADLPATQAVANSVPARRSGRHLGPVAWICVAACVAAVATVVGAVGSGHHVHIVLVPWWLILVALFVLRRRHRHRDRYEMPTAEITAAGTPGRDERP